MADITNQVTKAPSVLWDFIKAHYLIVLGVVLAAVVFAMAKKDALIDAFTTKDASGKMPATTRGDKLPAFLQRWFGLIPLALLFFVGISYSSEAQAATASLVGHAQALCAGAPCGHLGIAEWCARNWLQLVGWLGAGGGTMLGLTQFGAPDTLDLQETHGGDYLAVADGITATKPQSMYLKTVGHSTTKSKAPLVATDLTVELKCKVHQLSTGTASLDDQDMARLLDYIVIRPPLMGNLTDEKSGKGTVLDLVTRFIADEFERSGDSPIVSIVVPGTGSSSTDVIKYFTRPFALRFLDRPLTTAPWLGLLHEMNVSIGVAPDACLDAPSTGATVSDRQLRASVSYLPVPFWYYPLVAYDRVDNPASGSNGLTFKNFAGPGPDCTEKLDYVHTIGQLSSHKGLGGNLTFDSLTKILAPRFGLDSITNIAHLVKARLRAQYDGFIGGINSGESGNYVKGTANGNGMALDALMFLLLKQPSLNMEVANMLPMGPKDELPMQYLTSTARSGEDAFYFGAVRKVSSAVVPSWRSLPDSGMPTDVAAQVHFTKAR